MHIGVPRLMVLFSVLAIMSVAACVLLLYSPENGSTGLCLPRGAAGPRCVPGVSPRSVSVSLSGVPGYIPGLHPLRGGRPVCRGIVVEGGGPGYAGYSSAPSRYGPGHPRLHAAETADCHPPGRSVGPVYPGVLLHPHPAGHRLRVFRLGPSAPYPDVASMLSTGLLTLFIVVAIVFGTLLPLLIMNRKTRFY